MIRRKARKGIVLAINAYRRGIDTRAGERVWEHMIRPIIEYASEIWCTGKETDLERLQLQVGKALLGVGRSCASEVVRGELAWWRLASRADLTKLRFWARLVNMPKERLTRQVFEQRRLNSSEKQGTWCWKIRQILKSINMEQLWQHEAIPANLQKELNSRLQDREMLQWRQEINRKGKLECYQKLKTEWGREEYLDFTEVWRRKWITMFRGSNSDLLIETGRWINLQREDRKCRFCAQNVVEDEAHALLECKAYTDERRAMFDQIRESTKAKLNLEIMAHGKQWLMMVLIGPGIFDQVTKKITAIAVSNYLTKTAKLRHKLLSAT